MTETSGNLALKKETSSKFALPAIRTRFSSAGSARCIVVSRQKRQFNAINLHLYHYAGNNPVKYTDPDGKKYDEGPAGQAFRNKVKNENINKPISGGLLSPKQIGNILFNETRSLSGNKVNKAREHVAFTIINADQKYGDKRNKYASTASDKVNSIPEVEKDTYYKCQDIAYKVSNEVIDTTDGATHFYISKNPPTNHCGGVIKTSDGPLNNSFPNSDVPDKSGIYINTYGQ